MAEKPTKRRDAAQPKLITGFLSGLLYFFFIVGVSAMLALFAWNSAKDVLGLMKPDKAATIVVREGFEISKLASDLKDAGIIEQPWLFKLYARFSEAEEKIKPGEYEVNALLDYRALVRSMRGAAVKLEEIRISIPEGFTLKQIIELFAEKGVADADALWEVAQNHKYEYEFLGTVPFEKNRLEGYLFPDTYDFYIGENPVSVFNKMLSNFNKKFNSEYKERAKELGLSISEIITIASLVEKEAANDDERGLVGSVIYNRLNSKNMKKLQIDATIQYILPVPKAVLSQEDLDIDSPYNTRIYEGLPPGPIASPGLESIRAALYPEESGYYYYVLTSDYTHAFCKTLDEFNRVKAANQDFLNSLGQ